ncbi:MAG: hypothetical protein KJO07_16405 [Deltaproteobacteria bacterium]|nr:hypothetical protein [Deltaproteobacteria bacterium]
MAAWLVTVTGFLVLGGLAVVLGFEASPWVVWPPVASAVVVLVGAAMAVDYFGVARLRSRWRGFAGAHRQAWTRARALELRFYRQRKSGSPRTRSTARALLFAYAECDRLSDAREVVDYLGADTIYSGPGADAVADALRVIALAELGRGREASELLTAIERSSRRRRLPVVSYAGARLAQIEGRHRAAVERIDEALARSAIESGARRDLALLKARSLAVLGCAHDAAEVLSELAAHGARRAVEETTARAHERGEVALALAGRSALDQAAPYR